jgi:hypothetical protein
MFYECLLNKTMEEDKICEWLIRKLQANYDSFQHHNVFLKLENQGDGKSKIIWAKDFKDDKALDDFDFDTVYQRASIMFRFDSEKYLILCRGFYFSCLYKFSKSFFREMPGKGSLEFENKKMISKELLKGFDEISGKLIATRKLKAM